MIVQTRPVSRKISFLNNYSLPGNKRDFVWTVEPNGIFRMRNKGARRAYSMHLLTIWEMMVRADVIAEIKAGKKRKMRREK